MVRCCGDPVVDSPHGFLGPALPRLLDPENDSPALAGYKGEEESLLVARGRRTNLFNFPKFGSATLGVPQLHIHVMLDLKGSQ